MGDKNKIIYLILGLGIGIIIANILHSFYPKLEYVELSDDEIIERSTDLGMVKLKESIKLKKDPEDKKVENEIEEEEEEEEEEEKEKEIVVKSGSSLTRVARELYNLNLIEDEKEFISYVISEGFDRKIITGIYKIKYNTPYSEIIKILTDKTYDKD